MAAAAELFRERGFRETSLDDIGAAAGVSGPAIYRYFKSKDELLSVLIEEAAITWRETVDDVLNEDTPPLVTLERLIDAAIALQLKNGNLRDVFVQEYRSLDDDARRRVARIERVTMAEWVHLLCEVRPGLTDEEARAAVHDGRRHAALRHRRCTRRRPGPAGAGDEGHGRSAACSRVGIRLGRRRHRRERTSLPTAGTVAQAVVPRTQAQFRREACTSSTRRAAQGRARAHVGRRAA